MKIDRYDVKDKSPYSGQHKFRLQLRDDSIVQLCDELGVAIEPDTEVLVKFDTFKKNTPGLIVGG